MDMFVYVMKSESGLTKIGVSATPEKRRSVLESGSGFLIEVAAVFGPYSRATEVEAAAHRNIAHLRAIGEWFFCSADTAIDAVNKALEGFVDKKDPVAEFDSTFAEKLACMQAEPMISALHLASFAVQKYEEMLEEYSNLAEKIVDAAETTDFFHGLALKLLSENKSLEKKISLLEIQARNQTNN